MSDQLSGAIAPIFDLESYKKAWENDTSATEADPVREAALAALRMSPERTAAEARRGIFVNWDELGKFASALARHKRLDRKNAGIALRALVKGNRLTEAGFDAAYFCVDVADALGRKFPDGRIDSFEPVLRVGIEANGINADAFYERVRAAQAKEIARDEKDRQKTADLRKAGLVEGDDGKARNCLANVLAVLRTDSRWKERIRYNELSCRPVVSDEDDDDGHAADMPIQCKPGDWTDTHTTLLREWLQEHYDFEPGKDQTDSAVDAVAKENAFHPVAEYLRALQWDGQSRLEFLFPFYFGTPDSPYARMVSAKFMISAARRALEPGCKVDTMVILEGPQNIGKSTGVQILARRPEWFSDTKLNIEDKDGVQSLFGKWIIEVGEFAGMRRADVDSLKRFVSAQSDYIRISFGRRAEDYPRTCVFVATINPDGSGYLTDTTGNRRFWPIKCGVVNLERLRSDADQLWAEATHRALAGEPHWLTEPEQGALAGAEQAEREASDPWLEKVEAWLAVPGHLTDGHFRIGDLLNTLVDNERQTPSTTARVSKLLKVLGWTRKRVWLDKATNKAERRWVRAV